MTAEHRGRVALGLQQPGAQAAARWPAGSGWRRPAPGPRPAARPPRRRRAAPRRPAAAPRGPGDGDGGRARAAVGLDAQVVVAGHVVFADRARSGVSATPAGRGAGRGGAGRPARRPLGRRARPPRSRGPGRLVDQPPSTACSPRTPSAVVANTSARSRRTPALVDEPGQAAGARQHAQQRHLGQRHRRRAVVDQHDLVAGQGQLVAAAGRRAVERRDVGLARVRGGVLDAVAGLVGELAEVDLPGVRRPGRACGCWRPRRTSGPCRWSDDGPDLAGARTAAAGPRRTARCRRPGRSCSSSARSRGVGRRPRSTSRVSVATGPSTRSRQCRYRPGLGVERHPHRGGGVQGSGIGGSGVRGGRVRAVESGTGACVAAAA